MGRKAKPWYRQSHGAWYGTVAGKRTHLVTGTKEATEAQAQEVFRRLTGAGNADQRVQEINRVLVGRPEWIDVVRVVLGIREDVATFGRSERWFEMVREAMDGLAATVVEAGKGSNPLEVEPPVKAVVPVPTPDPRVDEIRKAIPDYELLTGRPKEMTDKYIAMAVRSRMSPEETRRGHALFMRYYSNKTDAEVDEALGKVAGYPPAPSPPASAGDPHGRQAGPQG